MNSLLLFCQVTNNLPELVQVMIWDIVNQPPPPPNKMDKYPRLKNYIKRWSVRKQLTY
jgi:hypothetical protein